MMYSINDYERIGDHCENIIELIQEIKDENSVFSKTAFDEYDKMDFPAIFWFAQKIPAALDPPR